MLYFVAVLALTLLSGAQGQNGTDINGAECLGVAITRPYDWCGSFGAGVNVYWTYVTETSQVNILFESSDDMYTAFGFSAGTASPMDGSNVVLGCQDWGLDGFDEAFEISLPDAGVTRNVSNVQLGAGANLLSAANVEESRINGLCGVRFERLTVLADVNGTDVDDLHNIVSGTENSIVWARGPSDQPLIHATRGAGVQDFILGTATGTITSSPLNVLVAAVTTTAVQPTEDGGNGSANIASLSSMLIGAVAALAAALW